MKTRVTRWLRALFYDEQNIHVRNFNLLALAGIAVSALVGTACLFTSSRIAVVGCYLLCGFSVWLMAFSARTKRYLLCYYLTIAVIFLLGFSVIFFVGGGYLSGMPLFFLFAVVFTAFLLEGARLIFAISLEIAVYALDILLAWRFPEMVTWLESTEAVMWDILTCLILVCAALGASACLQMMSYRRQQRELEIARNAADAANRAKTEFLANITHELKTPLTVISACAQTGVRHLEEFPEVKEDARRMRLIRTEAEHMAMLVSQLLDVARIDENRLVLNKKPVQLDEIIKRALDSCYPLVQKKNNHLVFNRLYDLPEIQVDEMRIRQILVNLLANAAEHTKEGTISVDMSSDGEMTEIRVQDSGEGIPAERLERVFERFSEKSGSAGTGLGLFICKHLVEAHGGTIAIESAPGEGTLVRFALPIKTASA